MNHDRGKQELKVLNRVAGELAQAKDLKQLKALRDKAEATRQYARSAALSLEIQNFAAEIKLRAERQAGILLEDLVPHGGNRRSSRRERDLKLSDLGINSGQSSRWRREAAVPEPLFERYVTAAKDLGRDITSQGLLRLHRIIIAGNQGGQRRPSAHRKRESSGSAIRTADGFRIWKSHRRTSDGITSTLDLLTEVSNHCDLLSSILRPVYEGNESIIQPFERRIVAQLFAEIQVLLGQIAEVCSSESETGDVG